MQIAPARNALQVRVAPLIHTNYLTKSQFTDNDSFFLLRINAHVSSAQSAAIAKDRERATINAKGRSRASVASPANVELEEEERGKRKGGRKEGGEGEEGKGRAREMKGKGERGRGGERQGGCAPPGVHTCASASERDERSRANVASPVKKRERA